MRVLLNSGGLWRHALFFLTKQPRGGNEGGSNLANTP